MNVNLRLTSPDQFLLTKCNLRYFLFDNTKQTTNRRVYPCSSHSRFILLDHLAQESPIIQRFTIVYNSCARGALLTGLFQLLLTDRSILSKALFSDQMAISHLDSSLPSTPNFEKSVRYPTDLA